MSAPAPPPSRMPLSPSAGPSSGGQASIGASAIGASSTGTSAFGAPSTDASNRPLDPRATMQPTSDFVLVGAHGALLPSSNVAAPGPAAGSGALPDVSGANGIISDGERLVGRMIVLGVSGGVAAYKSAELVRELQRAGALVQVVMTESAARFVTPITFQALSGRPVYTDQWDPRIANNMAHIELSRQADAILIAPASANTLSQLAQGLCPDLLTTMCLARECPLLVAPAMNRQMWDHPATRRNIAQLREDGVTMFGPGSGEQACGEVGDGRMLEPTELTEELTAWFAPKLLAGKRILMTAGPTYEPIDPVRGITNLSSGRMAYALARACRHAGAQVTMVTGPTHIDPPAGVKTIRVQTADEMMAAVTGELDVAASSIRIDVFIGVAAVADWRPARAADQKIKKSPSDQPTRTLELVENPDILASVARRPDAPFCVGFAAESENLVRHATEKLARKNIALIAANLGPQTFGSDENEIVLIDAHGGTSLGRASKHTLAQRMAREIARRLPSDLNP